MPENTSRTRRMNDQSVSSGTALAGGAGTIPDQMHSRSLALLISLIAISLALIIGLILQFGLQTGPLTLLLGCLGALPGFLLLHTAHPSGRKGVRRTVHRLLLRLAPACRRLLYPAGIYRPLHPLDGAADRTFHLQRHPAQRIPGSTLPTRPSARRIFSSGWGRRRGWPSTVLISILSWFCMYFSARHGHSEKGPVSLPSRDGPVGGDLPDDGRGKYENPLVLEMLCGLNIAVNLGTTVAYMLAFL